MNQQKIEELVALSVENENFSSYEIISHGKNGKNDGYIGSVLFLTVFGETKTGSKKSLDLVIKSGRESEVLRQQQPIKEAFHKEIYIYGRVLTTFQDLQKEKGNRNYLDFLPGYYTSQITPTCEFLVFEDLKKQGFELWDRKKSMTFEHVKLVLQAYGKWHAFSFAVKKYKKDVFEKLIEGNVNMLVYYFKQVGVWDLSVKLFEESRDNCISVEEKEILEKVTFSKDEIDHIGSGLFNDESDDRVILHGDCWNNNFLFKTDGDIGKPTAVRVLDWQLSGVASPADLSHFIYGNCDTGNHMDVSELLKIYHDSLSDCLVYLGCKSEELFSFSKLVAHWKQFSRYGLLLHGFVVKFTMVEPVTEETSEAQNDEVTMDFNVPLTDPKEYYRRIRNNLLHYVKNSS